MQTIIISLDSRKMENPDLDIRYTLPERIEEWSEGAVLDNGYDYIGDSGSVLAVWLETESVAEWWPKIVELLKTERFQNNDLSGSALMLISETDAAEYDACCQVYPE